MNHNVDCSACTDLKKNAPEFVQNGVTKTVCASLQNDTGLNPTLTTLHTDCEDLDTATDCMIGMMEKEVDSYDLCDWKDFMKKFINNLTQILKAIICAICGIWTNIHKLWDEIEKIWKQINKLWCYLNFIMKGASFYIGENVDGDAYAVAGRGVSFLIAHGSDEFTSDLSLQYIGGGLLRGNGSFRFFNDNFTDEKAVGNFDNGTAYRVSSSRKGNSIWGQYGRPATGGELICEFRFKNSTYPQVKSLWSGFGQETGGGAYHVQALVFDEGDWAYGQHGWCNSAGYAAEDGFDAGHQVPSGWTYVQVRLTFCLDMNANNTQYSPRYFMGIRINQDGIDC